MSARDPLISVDLPLHDAGGYDVIVLGASFAGVELVDRWFHAGALTGARGHGRPLRVALVDRQAAHPYIPLCHELLCGTTSVGLATLPTQEVVRARGAELHVGEVVRVQLAAPDEPSARHRVQLADGRVLCASQLVWALGSVQAPPWPQDAEHGPHALKSAAGLQRARAALAAQGPSTPMIVVGGGISAVELAGELVAVGRPVTLVYRGARLLPSMHPRVSRAATRALRAQGVQLRPHSDVRWADAAHVRLADGAELHGVVMWGGGVRSVLPMLDCPDTRDDAHGPALGSDMVLAASGRVRVDPCLRVWTRGPRGPRPHPRVWAAGDLAAVCDRADAEVWPTMQRAIEAIWQAGVVADNVLHELRWPADAATPTSVLRRHRLVRQFVYGVSLGRRSLIVYAGLVVPLHALNRAFRRLLLWAYRARYA